jgi:hypothetical protein
MKLLGTVKIVACMLGLVGCNSCGSDSPASSTSTQGTTPSGTAAITGKRSCGPIKWISQFQSIFLDTIGDLHVVDGGLIVTGYFARDVTFGVGRSDQWLQVEATPSSSWEGFIVHMDANGSPQWVRVVTGLGDANIVASDVAPDGTIYVAGISHDGAEFLDEDLALVGVVDAAAPYVLFVASYTPDGELRWAVPVHAQAHSAINSVLALDDGVYLGGFLRTQMTLNPGQSDEFVVDVDPANSSEPVLLHMDLEGTVQWARTTGLGPTAQELAGLVLRSDVVVGHVNMSFDPLVFGENEANEVTFDSDNLNLNRVVLAAFNKPDGTLAWAKQVEGITNLDITAISDGLVRAGSVAGIETTFGLGLPSQTTIPVNAGYLVRHNDAGDQVWATANHEGVLFQNAVVERNGLIAAAGMYVSDLQMTADGGNFSVDAFNDHDGLVSFWNLETGAYRGAYNFTGPDTDDAFAVDIDADGSVYVAGEFADVVTFFKGGDCETTLTALDRDIVVVKFAAPQ